MIKTFNSSAPSDPDSIPTFPDFAKFLLFKNNVASDPHIRPYWHCCNVCFYNYTYIAKVETTEADTNFLMASIPALNMEKRLEFNPSSGGDTEDLARKYFAQMTKTDVKSLAERYKFDFDAFGYDFQEFVDLAKE